MADKLADIFDVEATEIIPPTKLVPNKPPTNTDTPLERDLLADLQISRQDFDTIIDLGKTALENVLTIAEQGQHPRFYEAAAILIKNISDANKERMELHLKLSQIRKNQAEIGQGQASVTVEKAVFVGTTAELLGLVNPRNKQLSS